MAIRRRTASSLQVTGAGAGAGEVEGEAEAEADVDAGIEIVADTQTGPGTVAGPPMAEDVAAVGETSGLVSVAIAAAPVSTSLPVGSSRRRCRQSYSEEETDWGRDSSRGQRSRGSGYDGYDGPPFLESGRSAVLRP